MCNYWDWNPDDWQWIERQSLRIKISLVRIFTSSFSVADNFKSLCPTYHLRDTSSQIIYDIFLGRIFEIILFKINLHELSFSLLVASMGETMAKSDKNLVQKYLELDQCGRYRKSKAMNMQLQILFFWQGPSIVYLDWWFWRRH